MREREREREREHAVPRAGRRSVRVEGNARGGGGAAQDGIPRRAGGASDGGEREHTNPFFPINFQEIYITHPDPNTPIQFSRTDLR